MGNLSWDGAPRAFIRLLVFSIMESWETSTWGYSLSLLLTLLPFFQECDSAWGRRHEHPTAKDKRQSMARHRQQWSIVSRITGQASNTTFHYSTRQINGLPDGYKKGYPTSMASTSPTSTYFNSVAAAPRNPEETNHSNSSTALMDSRTQIVEMGNPSQ